MYWLTDIPIINRWARLERIINFLLKQYALLIKKQTNKYKEKLVILQSIGIIVIKSKIRTRVVTYSSRYSGGHLIII